MTFDTTAIASYDDVLSAFLDTSASAGLAVNEASRTWTELWPARGRRCGYDPRCYVVTHGLPNGRLGLLD